MLHDLSEIIVIVSVMMIVVIIIIVIIITIIIKTGRPKLFGYDAHWNCKLEFT
jgi:low affinity Fe/Cu permease